MRWGIDRIDKKDYLIIIKRKREKCTTDEIYKWIKDNDIDEKYNCLKATGRQRKVEFSEKYSVYIYFSKDLYDIDDILNKIDFLLKMGLSMPFLDKPPQSWEYIKKIKIKE